MCLLQQTFPSTNILARDLSSGIDTHVKLEEKDKPKQTKATARHHLSYPPTNQSTNQLLMPEFGMQFWYKKNYLKGLFYKDMHLVCSGE